MYQVFSLDLANVVPTNAPRKLVDPGKRIAEVFCLSVPPGAVFRIGFGQGDRFSIGAPFTFEPTGDEDNNSGLYFDNANAQPGTVIEMIVVFAQQGSSGLNPIIV